MMSWDDCQQLLLSETFFIHVCLTHQKFLILGNHVGSALTIQYSLNTSASVTIRLMQGVYLIYARHIQLHG